MTFAIDSFKGNLNCTIKRNTNDKTLIIILQSVKATYAKCCLYDVKKHMKNIYNICRYASIAEAVRLDILVKPLGT